MWLVGCGVSWMEAWPLLTRGGLALTSPGPVWLPELALSCLTQAPAGGPTGSRPRIELGSPAGLEVTLATSGPCP